MPLSIQLIGSTLYWSHSVTDVFLGWESVALVCRVSNTSHFWDFIPCCVDTRYSMLLVFPPFTYWNNNLTEITAALWTISSSLPRLLFVARLRQCRHMSLMSLFSQLSEKRHRINKLKGVWLWWIGPVGTGSQLEPVLDSHPYIDCCSFLLDILRISHK